MRYTNKYVIYAVLTAIVMFIPTAVNAALSQISYDYQEQRHELAVSTTETAYVPVRNPLLYIASGIGNQVQVNVYHENGALVHTYLSPAVQLSDSFEIDGVTYQGITHPLQLPGDFEYRVETNLLNNNMLLSQTDNTILVDSAAPQISGTFFWNAPHGNKNIRKAVHTDGKHIVSLRQAQQAGFDNVVAPRSGIKSVSFTSTFLDGPMAGQVYADELSADFTVDGLARIGNGTNSSITTAYLPNNTSAQMRLTYTVTSHAGVAVSRSEDVYVSTKRPATQPEPYAVFTGQNVQLDGVAAFTGYVAYTPGMAVLSNPVRMIYRAPRSEYYGGGGNADIYGAWVGTGARNTDNIVHSDATYLYYEIQDTSQGTQYPNHQRAAHFSKWSTSRLYHSLSLNGNSAPPTIESVAYFLNGQGTWVTDGSPFVTYANLSTFSVANDTISRVRVTVQPRPYQQSFSYSFHGQNQTCHIDPGESVCEVAINLSYPANTAGDYDHAFTVFSIQNAMVSASYDATWHYDGMPTQLSASPFGFSADNKRLTVNLTKTYTDSSLGDSKIRSVKPFAIALSDITGQANTTTPPITGRQYFTRIQSPSSVTNGNEVNFSADYDVSVISSGEFAYYVEVEDGFPTLTQTNIHYLTTYDIPDNAPPVIQPSIQDGATVSSLNEITFDVADDNNGQVTQLLIAGGPNSINMNAPILAVDVDTFMADQIYLVDSAMDAYSIQVTATDAFNNVATETLNFIYEPQSIAIPDSVLPAIASPLRSLNGKPNNVILTPPIRDTANQLARGVHTVYFSLEASSPSAFMINGQQVNPGEMISLQQNLTLNNHRLRIEAYPASSGVETEADYTLHFPDIKVSVCPPDFNQNALQCTYLDIKPSEIGCGSPYSLTENNTCEWVLSYPMAAECKSGYSRNDLTCSANISVDKVKSCPLFYGLSLDGSSCEQHTTVQVEQCVLGAVFEDGMCKLGGNFSPTGLYCAGHDVSSGQHCDGNKCYTYKPEWNACEVVTSIAVTETCVEGVDNGSDCLLAHSYELDATCDFGFTRNGLECSRLLIENAQKQCAANYTLSQDGNSCISVTYEPFTGCPDASHSFVNGRCHELAAVDIVCPDPSYTWTRLTCEKEITYNANATCPTASGWTDNGTTGCDYFDQKNAESCKPGFLYTSGECFEVVAADQVCPLNHVNNGAGLCEYSDSISPASCPNGFNEITGQCYEVVEANQTCSQPGFAVDSDTGICRKLDVEPIESCPEGSLLIDGKCHEVEQAAASCTAPYVDVDGVCTYEQNSTIEACPEGHLFDNNQCFEIVDADKVCATGYALNPDRNNICEKIILSNVSSCPENFTLDNGFCYPVVDASQECPAGYVNDGDGTCSRLQLTTIHACSGFPNSVMVDQSCYDTLPADYACPEGSTMKDYQCYEGDGPSAPQPQCATGTLRDDGLCDVDQFVNSRIMCAPGQVMKNADSTGAPGYKGYYAYSMTTQQIIDDIQGATCHDATAPTPIWGEGYTEGYDFEAYWYATSVLYQPSSGDGCPKSLPYYNSKDNRCWKSKEHADRGTIVQKTASNAVCPLGYTWTLKLNGVTINHNVQCVKDTGAQLTLDYGRCWSYGYNYSSTTGDCTRTIQQQPVDTCSDNETLIDGACYGPNSGLAFMTCNADGYSLYNDSFCKEDLANNALALCETDTQVYNAEINRCEETLHAATSYGCGGSPGYSLFEETLCKSGEPDYAVGDCGIWGILNTETGRCEAKQIQPVSYACDPTTHASYESTKCLANDASLTVGQCPTNFSLQPDGSCKWTQTDDYLYTCDPTHLLYSQTECLARQPNLELGNCQSTFTLDTGEGDCRRELTDPINYTCEPQFSLITQTSCQADAPSLSVGNCDQNGYTLNPQTGLCDIYLSEPVDYQCETDFNNYQTDKCLDSNVTTNAGVCSLPFILNASTGKCEHSDYQNYTYQCSPSSNGEPVTLNGASCSHMAYQTEQRGCSTAFSMIDQDTCQADQPTPFEGSCNSGFTALADQCEMSQTDSFQYYCTDASYTLDVDQCKKLLEATVDVVCQPDEVAADGSCYRTESSNKTPYCDAPYHSKSSSLCERSVDISTL